VSDPAGVEDVIVFATAAQGAWDVVHLREEVARLTRERDEAEGSLAGLADCINQELRENGPVEVEQVPSVKADMRPFVRKLVDYVREQKERAAAREQAELRAAERLRRPHYYESEEGWCDDQRDKKPLQPWGG